MTEIKNNYRDHEYTIKGEEAEEGKYQLTIMPLDRARAIDCGAFPTIVAANKEARKRIDLISQLAGKISSYEP